MTVTSSTVDLGLISLDYDSWGDLLAASRAWGLPMVELYVEASITEGDVGEVRRALATSNTRVSSVSSLAKVSQAADGNEVDEHTSLVRRSIRMAAELGAPFATFMYGGCVGLAREQALERFIDRVAPLCAEAKESGVKLLVENVFSRVPPGDLDEVDWSVTVFERLAELDIALNFDVGNYAVSGEEAVPYAWERLRRFARSMHIKNVVPYRPDLHGALGQRRELKDHRRGLHVSVPPSEGVVNYAPVFADLAAGNFDGPVLLEPFASGPQRDTWIKRALVDLTRSGVVEGVW